MKFWINLIATFLIIIALASCGSPSNEKSDLILEPTPSDMDFNLDGAFEYGLADGTFTQSITVFHNGRVLRSSHRGALNSEKEFISNAIGEEYVDLYENKSSRDLVTSWSTGKSFTSILIGIAIDQSFISGLDQSASDYIFEWQNDDRADITIRHILNMRSGLFLYDGGNGGNITSFKNQLDACINRTLQTPRNNNFLYSNCDSMVLGEILVRATGKDFFDFADEHLFSQLDIDAQWWTDQNFNYLSYCCIDMTQEEFLKFGQMILNNGGGIISESYITEILSNNGESYNLQFWFQDNALMTIGYDGQFIVIDFANNVLVLRNSLYHQLVPINGQTIMINNQNGQAGSTQIPLTLPTIFGGEQTFNISEFLNILYRR